MWIVGRKRWQSLFLSFSSVKVAEISAFRSNNPSALRYGKTIRFASTDLSCSNHLMEVPKLQNDFYALRHGQSLANVATVISSHPDVATIKHGLSDVGKEQAQRAASDLIDIFDAKKYNSVAILSSDYLRAKETAQFVSNTFQKKDLPVHNGGVVLETRLRERWFGKWDGGSDEHYSDVWKDDAIDPSHTIGEVESVMSVMDRTTTCVLEWDKVLGKNNLIICTAHGDVLQILQTAFSKMDGSLHRTLEHLETATPRSLILGGS
mmetsp:Transcript_12582/g.19497  ORF Transcript_12582/g.19497 Transcript_12582/m.19497 type:complete len:264 (+) Transcript_12582:446-1237(+)